MGSCGSSQNRKIASTTYSLPSARPVTMTTTAYPYTADTSGADEFVLDITRADPFSTRNVFATKTDIARNEEFKKIMAMIDSW